MKRKPQSNWEARIIEVVALHEELSLGELAAIMNAPREAIKERVEQLCDLKLDDKGLVRFVGNPDDLGA